MDFTKATQLRKQYITQQFSHLNNMQQSAVYHIKGPLLILAGAGSGKTSVLINRISNMVRFGDSYNSPYFPGDVSDETLAMLEDAVANNTKLDFDTLMVHTEAGQIELRKKEFELLEKMLSSPMKIFTRQALMDDIWGYDSESASRTVDAHIKRLRAKLKDVNDFEIETIRGLGYKAVIRK